MNECLKTGKLIFLMSNPYLYRSMCSDFLSPYSYFIIKVTSRYHNLGFPEDHFSHYDRWSGFFRPKSIHTQSFVLQGQVGCHIFLKSFSVFYSQLFVILLLLLLLCFWFYKSQSHFTLRASR